MTESDSAEDTATHRPGRSRVCKQCKFSTTDAWSFSQHQLNAHRHEAAAIHVCETCNYATASYTDWQRHQRSHSGYSRQSSEGSTGQLYIGRFVFKVMLKFEYLSMMCNSYFG